MPLHTHAHTNVHLSGQFEALCTFRFSRVLLLIGPSAHVRDTHAYIHADMEFSDQHQQDADDVTCLTQCSSKATMNCDNSTKCRKEYGTSQRAQDKRKRYGTLLTSVEEMTASLKRAEHQGVIKRFMVFVQDNDQNFICDSSAQYQGWLREASGLAKTLEDIDTGKFRARTTSVEEMNRMKNLYPTCGSAMKLLTVPDMRALLSGLSWSKVKKAARSNSLPGHMARFNMNKRPLYMQTASQAREENPVSDEPSEANSQPNKRRRDDEGRFAGVIDDCDRFFDMESWQAAESNQVQQSTLINVHTLFQKDLKNFNQCECAAALGLTLEYYNPGNSDSYIHTYIPTYIHTYILNIHTYTYITQIHTYTHAHVYTDILHA